MLRQKQTSGFIVIGLLVTFTLGVFMAAKPAYAAATCGSTITSNTTLTGNLNCATPPGITIGANGITLDCARYSITGPGSSLAGTGIDLSGRTKVTVKNCIVNNWVIGFEISSSSGNVLAGNTASSNGVGFFFSSSSGNILTGNTASNNKAVGFYFASSSSQNILTGNAAISNVQSGFYFDTSSTNTLKANIARGNGGDGFYLNALSSGNTLTLNAAISNEGYGYEDKSSGLGTAGTANRYVGNWAIGNKLGASNPPGLAR